MFCMSKFTCVCMCVGTVRRDRHIKTDRERESMCVLEFDIYLQIAFNELILTGLFKGYTGN